MNRIKYICLLLFIIISCVNQDLDEIEVFEKTLGNKYTKILTDGLEKFENELTRLYPHSDINKSYIELVSEIVNWNGEANRYFGRFDTTFVIRLTDYFQSHNLEKEIVLTPSFVGMRNGKFTIIYDYINDHKDTIRLSEGEMSFTDLEILQLDSLIELEYSVIDYNPFGLYHQALCDIKSTDSLIIDYIESKNNGWLPRELKFYPFYYGEPNYSDYIIKRIVLIEFLY